MGCLRISTHHVPPVVVLCLLLRFSLLFFFMAATSATTTTRRCLEAERNALLAFKAGLHDPSCRLSSWRDYHDCCRWSGVVCDDTTGHVVELNLQNPLHYYDPNGVLRGEISPSLLSLTHLVRLNLTQNDFGGSQISAFLGSLKKLRYLDLSWSNFSGAIPPQLGNLTCLLYLGLASSSDLNPIRADKLEWLSHLSSLTYLDMSFVNLSQASNGWLQAINMLPSLETLFLGECDLHSLPSSLSHVNLTSLSSLGLSGNLFNSSFPSWLPKLRSLSNLAISNSQLHGTIPVGIRNLTRLTQLDLSGNSLSGPIAEIWNSTRLTRLELSYNLFTGSIPAAIGNLISLSQLYIVGCKLTGPVPAEVQYLTNLSEAELSGNSLNGSIPFEIGNLTSLSQLKLDKNSLSGSLPVEIGKLSNLTLLDLSLNSLEAIVSEHHFANLTNLGELYFYGNPLVFAIDQNWVPSFQLISIALGSSNLGPQFPGWLCSQQHISYLDLSNTSIEGTLPDWFWNAILHPS